MRWQIHLTQDFSNVWNNIEEVISKRTISGYFSKAQLLYSSVTLGDVCREQSFPKFLCNTFKTMGLYSKPELSARNQ